MRAVGFFADLNYYPSLVTVINSILYYGVNAKVKVYDYHGLPHLLKTYLSNYVDVVPVPEALFDRHYYHHYYFRPRILNAVGIEEHEVLLDVDTVVLSDLEEIFSEVEKGNVVVLKEWDYINAKISLSHEDIPDDSLYIYNQIVKHPDVYEDLPDDSIFHQMLKYPDVYKEGLRIYNGGLLGFNKKKHSFIFDLWAQSTQDHDNLRDTFFLNDQHNLSLILASLLKENRVTIHELPKDLWMQTWSLHREPKKFLSFENEKIAIYDGKTGKKLKFYHYTGDIIAPKEITGRDKQEPARFQFLLGDIGLPDGFTRQEMVELWHYVWRKRHETPAGELPMFFYNLGPLRVPKCINPSWREFLARILKFFEGNPTIHKDSKETWALAFVYDYIDYCGYRGVDLGWMSNPLKLLIDPEVITTGDNTISWDSSADVVIGFHSQYDDMRDWIHTEHNYKSRFSEHHKGVFLNIR